MDILLSPGPNKVTVPLVINEFAEETVLAASERRGATGFDGLAALDVKVATCTNTTPMATTSLMQLFALHMDPSLTLFSVRDLAKKVGSFKNELIANLDNEHQAFKKLSKVFKKHGVTKEDLVSSIQADGTPPLPLLVYMANLLRTHIVHIHDADKLFVRWAAAAEDADAYMEVSGGGLLNLHASGYKAAVIQKKMNGSTDFKKLRVTELRDICGLLGYSKSTALKAEYIDWLTETLK